MDSTPGFTGNGFKILTKPLLIRDNRNFIAIGHLEMSIGQLDFLTPFSSSKFGQTKMMEI